MTSSRIVRSQTTLGRAAFFIMGNFVLLEYNLIKIELTRMKIAATRFWLIAIGIGAIASGCNYLISPLQYGMDSCFFLPNGYTYQVVNDHHLYKGGWNSEGRRIDSFEFGNRIYIDDRYVVGEVIPTGTGSKHIDSNEEVSKYEYFILDTKAGKYAGKLNKAQWQRALQDVGIESEVKLEPRSAWTDKMWRQYGRGKQC